MTPLQFIDRLAFCIGYGVMGAAALLACIGAALMLFDLAVIWLVSSIGRDNDQQQGDD